jgi:hypothetical protein
MHGKFMKEADVQVGKHYMWVEKLCKCLSKHDGVAFLEYVIGEGTYKGQRSYAYVEYNALERA